MGWLQRQVTSTNLGATDGDNSMAPTTRAQQVAKEANQVEFIFQRPSVRKPSTLTSPPSKRKFRHILPSDKDRLFEDTTEDPTLVPSDLYDDDVGGSKNTM